MRSIVGDSTQTVANVSPFSNMVYYALNPSGGTLTSAGLTTSNASTQITSKVSSVLTNFGFGSDLTTDGSSTSSFNPLTMNFTSSSGSTTLATFIQAAESLSETVRRTASAAGGITSANLASIFQALGGDLSDGTMDGNSQTIGGTSSAISVTVGSLNAASIRSWAVSNATFVLNEMFSDTGLQITDNTGTKHNALTAIKSSVTSVKSDAVAVLTSVKADTKLVAQWDTAKSTAFALLGVSTLAELEFLRI
jgi:hypothetical protein